MNNYTTKKHKRQWIKVGVIAAALTLIISGSVAVGVRRAYIQQLKPVSTAQESKLITIPLDSTPHDIALILEEQGVIRKAWAFEWYVRNNNLRSKLQAGTYALKPSQSIQEIAQILTQGKIATDLVTILPGKRIEAIRDDLINQGFDAKEVDAALRPEVYRDHPALVDKPKNATLEGYLYPESFQKTADTRVQTVIRQSLDEMQKQLTPELRRKIVKQGLTVHDGIILASVIGQEVHDPKDQHIVAQVFLKRLKDGIELGADATTRYAINKPTGPLTAADLDSNSPYNTRKFTGLPPGPISNFNASALAAIGAPAKSDFLFFVTGRDCETTRFSRTIDEHQALIRQYGACGEE